MQSSLRTGFVIVSLVLVLSASSASAAKKNVTFYDFFASNWELTETYSSEGSWFTEEKPFAFLQLAKDAEKTYLFGNWTTMDGETVLKATPVKIEFASPNAGRFLVEIDQEKRTEITNDEEFVGAEIHKKLFEFNFSQFAQNLLMSFGKWAEDDNTESPMQLVLQPPHSFLINIYSSQEGELKMRTIVGKKHVKNTEKTFFGRYGIYILLVAIMIGSRYLRSGFQTKANEALSSVASSQTAAATTVSTAPAGESKKTQ